MLAPEKPGAPHPCQNRPASPNLAANLAARDEWQVAMSSGSDEKRKFRNLLPPSGAGIGDAAALGGRNERLNHRPLIVVAVAGVAQFAAVVPPAVLRRPDRDLRESGHPS
jgi:hypothetical protein